MSGHSVFARPLAPAAKVRFPPLASVLRKSLRKTDSPLRLATLGRCATPEWPLWRNMAMGMGIPRLLADSHVLCHIPRLQRLHEPLRSTPPARPGQRRVLRVPVFRRCGRTGGFRLIADEFGQGVGQIPGEGFHFGAGFRLLPILIGGDRLGDVLAAFSSVC